MKAIIIVGLPASGKTTLANNLIKDNCFMLFDDVSVSEKLFSDMNDHIKSQKDLVITDPYICLKNVQDVLKNKLIGYDIEWIYFENDPNQCLINASFRDKKVDGLIKNLSKQYYMPNQVVPMKVFSND